MWTSLKTFGKSLLVIAALHANAVLAADPPNYADYDVGVKMNEINPEPLPFNELTGTSTTPEDYNRIQDDVRGILKGASDMLKAGVKGDRGSRDALYSSQVSSAEQAGSSAGGKSQTMAVAYNSLITMATCNGVLNLDGAFTGTATCYVPAPGDPQYCNHCTGGACSGFRCSTCYNYFETCYNNNYNNYNYWN